MRATGCTTWRRPTSARSRQGDRSRGPGWTAAATHTAYVASRAATTAGTTRNAGSSNASGAASRPVATASGIRAEAHIDAAADRSRTSVWNGADPIGPW